MPDFRDHLYKKYNSAFKEHISSFDHKIIENEWSWYKYKYLPLIKNYQKNASIMELGCGRGIMLEFLKNHGYNNLKGIDISEEQIQIAQAKNLIVNFANALEFFNTSDNTYDIIIALDFIEHFSKDELIKLFKLIFDRLNKGGSFIIHTPNGQAILSSRIIYGDLTHLTIFNPYSLLQILRFVGFNSINFYERGPVPKNLKGIIRTILWRIIKIFYNLLLLIESGKSEKILTQNFICVAKKL
jgi:2-polyprenyl-3-methyl-5-hydroxy-6-metoxy-1,4-benzoquinol methylase